LEKIFGGFLAVLFCFTCFAETVHFAHLGVGSQWRYLNNDTMTVLNFPYEGRYERCQTIKTITILDTIRRNDTLVIVYSSADTGYDSIFTTSGVSPGGPHPSIDTFRVDTCVIPPGAGRCNCDSFLPVFKFYSLDAYSCRADTVPGYPDTFFYSCGTMYEFNDSNRLYKVTHHLPVYDEEWYLESCGLYHYYYHSFFAYSDHGANLTATTSKHSDLISFNGKSSKLATLTSHITVRGDHTAPAFLVEYDPHSSFVKLNLNFAAPEQVGISLLSTNGKILNSMYRGIAGGKTRQMRFSTIPYPAGLYLVRLATGNKSYTQKLLIMK
jgi:hypothetical protein